MNPATLSKLFATLKNPTAEASMASALPSVEGLEEYNPTDLEMFAESGILTPDTPDDTYMGLTDDDIALLTTKKWGTVPDLAPRTDDNLPF